MIYGSSCWCSPSLQFFQVKDSLWWSNFHIFSCFYIFSDFQWIYLPWSCPASSWGTTKSSLCLEPGHLILLFLLLEDAVSLYLLPPWHSWLCRPLSYILSQHRTPGYRTSLMSEPQRRLFLSYSGWESATTNALRCKSMRKEGVKPLPWLSGTSHCYCHREISNFCLDCWKCQQGKQIFVCKT